MGRIAAAMCTAGLLTLAGSTAAWAQSDTFRLGTSSSGTVSGGTDTELVYGRGGHHHSHWGGGYGYGRGYWGSGYGYGRGYWGGYGYGGGYWGGYAAYRPYYYRPAYYRPFVYVNYYQPYYYAAPAYYYPISGQTDVPTTLAQMPAKVQQATSQYQSTTARPQLLPMPSTVPQQPGGLQTFPYDGGPQAPLPLPQIDPASGPRPIVPLQGKVVSLPVETTGGTTQFITVSLGTSAQPAVSPRYSYPAYGEQPQPAMPKYTR